MASCLAAESADAQHLRACWRRGDQTLGKGRPLAATKLGASDGTSLVLHPPGRPLPRPRLETLAAPGRAPSAAQEQLTVVRWLCRGHILARASLFLQNGAKRVWNLILHPSPGIPCCYQFPSIIPLPPSRLVAAPKLHATLRPDHGVKPLATIPVFHFTIPSPSNPINPILWSNTIFRSPILGLCCSPPDPFSPIFPVQQNGPPPSSPPPIPSHPIPLTRPLPHPRRASASGFRAYTFLRSK